MIEIDIFDDNEYLDGTVNINLSRYLENEKANHKEIISKIFEVAELNAKEVNYGNEYDFEVGSLRAIAVRIDGDFVDKEYHWDEENYVAPPSFNLNFIFDNNTLTGIIPDGDIIEWAVHNLTEGYKDNDLLEELDKRGYKVVKK